MNGGCPREVGRRMTTTFDEFKQSLIRARVAKFIDRYLKVVQDELVTSQEKPVIPFQDDAEENSGSLGDEILAGILVNNIY